MKKVKRGSSFSFFSLHPFVLLSLFSFPFHSFSLYFIVNERDKGKEQLEQRQREI